MGIFRRKIPSHLIPVHPVNATSRDWLILLEAGTIIGPSTERLRVARSTLEKKIVKKYDILLRVQHFLIIEGYDPRIHAVYFCPQLYKYDTDKKLVPLQGEEIGRLIAHAVEGGIRDRRPWYEPSEELPDQPIINTPMQAEFDIANDPPANTFHGPPSLPPGLGGTFPPGCTVLAIDKDDHNGLNGDDKKLRPGNPNCQPASP